MTNRCSTKRTSPAPPGVKILITTGSVAATLAGWAAFAAATPPPVTTALTPITQAIDALPPTTAPGQAALPTIAALPTLVPEAAELTRPAETAAQAPAATATQPPASAAEAPPATATPVPPKVVPPTATVQPRTVSPPAAVIRPQAPAARSRSSR